MSWIESPRMPDKTTERLIPREQIKKCQHGRFGLFCCKCNYGNTGHHHESHDFDNPRDLIYELEKTTIKQKLKDGWPQ